MQILEVSKCARHFLAKCLELFMKYPILPNLIRWWAQLDPLSFDYKMTYSWHGMKRLRRNLICNISILSSKNFIHLPKGNWVHTFSHQYKV